jgi:phosphopantetheinyl transferase (holo-ACP synthase)
VSYAAHFAAKESPLKALDTGGRDDISWLEGIEEQEQ